MCAPVKLEYIRRDEYVRCTERSACSCWSCFCCTCCCSACVRLGGNWPVRSVTDFRVKYDKDKAMCWHAADAAWDAAEEAGYCDGGWVLVNDKCSITMKPLTIPARTGTCQHVARCNLADLASWKRKCPDCSATFRGRKTLVVDGLLRDALALARSAGKQVWQSPRGAYALRDHRDDETIHLD